MKKMNKKGFTIVELVIVIAVIAILAAVLIPTYSSLVKKANESADIQAVRQMNTILATYTDGSVTDVTTAVKALDKEDIDLENYKPMQKDHYFYFYMDGNTPKIVYMDAKDNVVFPKDAKTAGVQLMSLSGDVPTDSDYTISNNAVTIDSGAKLAHLIDAKKNTSENLTITLSSNVDLRGAAVDFGQTTGNITIQGEEGKNAVLSGLRADDNAVSPTSGEFASHKYGYGLFGDINKGTVTIENITISGLSVGNSLATHESGANTIGLIAGYIKSDAKVVLKDVTFKDCAVYGYQKVGGIVGQLHGTLEMDNVKFENVVVNGALEVAKVAGMVSKEGNLKADTNCDFSGITTNALQSDLEATFTQNEVGDKVSGDANNTYGYWKGWHGSNDSTAKSYHENVLIFGIVTNDLAWYDRGESDKAENITVKGAQYSLNAWTRSTSKNILAGVPED